MAKPTAQQLLERIKQIKSDAEVFKQLWQESFPPELALPPDWEIKNAVRRLALADLTEGIQSYLVILSRENPPPPNPKKALSYICATAWRIRERENPEQNFPPTTRRLRNAAEESNNDKTV